MTLNLIPTWHGHTKAVPNKRQRHIEPVPVLVPFIDATSWAALFTGISVEVLAHQLAVDGYSAPYGIGRR
jgi:hypothetical protein